MNLSQLIPIRAWSTQVGLNFDMINDVERNKFYDHLLYDHVKGKVCSDIGFGSGILTMMALNHGAEHVYAYEKDYVTFEVGKEVINRMGYGDRVTFIQDKFDNRYDSEVVFHEILLKTIWGDGLYEIYKEFKGKFKFLPSKMRCEIRVNDNQEKVNKQHWLYTENLKPHYTYNPDDEDPDYGIPRTDLTFNPGIDYLDDIAKVFKDIQNTEKHYVIRPEWENQYARKRIDLDFIDTIGSYDFDLNSDDVPEVIKVPINVPENSLITCKYSSHGHQLQRVEGHWSYDKILWTKDGGEKVFHQRTTDGTWWIE